jgi:uncharacterized protein YjbI with pentapeptide repeats
MLMKKCEYRSHRGGECKEVALPDSNYCMLHIDLPEDENSDEFERIKKLKDQKVKEKVNESDFNFEGAKLVAIDFSKMNIEDTLNFADSIIRESAKFEGTTIRGFAFFPGAIIKNVEFRGATIEKSAIFEGAIIAEDVDFTGATIEGSAMFTGAKIKNAWFSGVTIKKDAVFYWATIDRCAMFTHSNINFLTFEKAKFKDIRGEEESCRTARIILEKSGNRDLADYHFYREMVAKRKQGVDPLTRRWKTPVMSFFEWMIADLTCKYGTDYLRPILLWTIVVLIAFPIIYHLGGGIENAKSFLDSLYFSIVTATTLGYGDLRPSSVVLLNIPVFRMLASIEAIFGSFMWAAFIVIFARKFMR